MLLCARGRALARRGGQNWNHPGASQEDTPIIAASV